MASSSRLVIKHDPSTGDVNLLQVAHFVKGNHARKHVEAAIKALGLPRRSDRRLGGAGVPTIIGTYDEALKIAKHLGASDDDIKEIEGALVSLVSDGNGGQNREILPTSGREFISFDEGQAKNAILTILGSDSTYPILFDYTWSDFCGVSRNHVNDVVETAIASGRIVEPGDVTMEDVFNPITGTTRGLYKFTVTGFKLFFMGLHTDEGRRFCNYFIRVEAEFNRVLPELRRSQDENRQLRAENESLKAAKVDEAWRNNRKDTLVYNKKAMDKLQEIVAVIDNGVKLFPIVQNLINQATLDLPCNSTSFKAGRNMGKSLSIPDILDEKGLRTRSRVLELFLDIMEDRVEEFKKMPVEIIASELQKMTAMLGHTNNMYYDLKDRLLTNSEAKRRKKDLHDMRRIEAAQQGPQLSSVVVVQSATNAKSSVEKKQSSLKSFFTKK